MSRWPVSRRLLLARVRSWMLETSGSVSHLSAVRPLTQFPSSVLSALGSEKVMQSSDDVDNLASDLARGLVDARRQNHWPLSDEVFFCTGACHILAQAFLDAYPAAGFRPYMIKPSGGHKSGCHVFVASEDQAFDCHGYATRQEFIARHFAEMRQSTPDWEGQEQPIASSDLVEGAFCQENGFHSLSAFPGDAQDRARRFLRSFPLPAG